MNAPIRRIGGGLIVLMLALIGQLSYLQVVHADKLARDPRNFRVSRRDISKPRGSIVTIDGVIVAASVPSKDDLKQLRTYPQGTLYAHVTGFQSLYYGTTGIERSYDDTLVGRDVKVQLDDLGKLLNPNTTRNVRLTIDSVAQTAAAKALNGRRGSVVVLDTRTGGVVAMYSNPTFDPNTIATHNDVAARKSFNQLTADPTNPMLSRVARELFPPGSTFKVVSTAIALDAQLVTPESQFPVLRQLDLPLTTRTLSNFGGKSCGGSLRDSFRKSCNTTFGQIGLDLGERFVTGSERFGLNHAAPPFDWSPGIVASRGPLPGTFKAQQPQFALDAIGQGDIAVTPIHMALVAESVATGGIMHVPHLMSSIEDPNDPTHATKRAATSTWRSVMKPGTASLLNEFMQLVVSDGTGTAAQLQGITMAGKTGTAQTRQGNAPHAWFIGFAPAQAPKYAIAVLLENDNNQNFEATGGKIAAPVARDVLTAVFLARGTS